MPTALAPAPAPHAHFNPVDFTRTIFEKGKPPRTETERRHMTFNVWSYRRMCEEAGVDIAAMADRARSISARRELMVKQYGEKRGVKKLTELLARENEAKGPLYQMLPTDDLDQFQQTCFIVWGALLAEDAALSADGEPALTVGDVSRAMTAADVQAYLFAEASDSLMRYLFGKGLDGMRQAAEDAGLADDAPLPGEQPGDSDFDEPDGDSGNVEAPAKKAKPGR